jgi:hypothetical protein
MHHADVMTDEVPAALRDLITRLLEELLRGDAPQLGVLRDQARKARIDSVEVTGVGFFAHLEVPDDSPMIDEPRLAGGNATIELRGLRHGAGCVLFVDDGRLSVLEGYTFAGEAWPEVLEVVSITNPIPLIVGGEESDHR